VADVLDFVARAKRLQAAAVGGALPAPEPPPMDEEIGVPAGFNIPPRAATGDALGADPRFNTALAPDEETQFQAWKAQYAPQDSGVDYDLRGAFKAGLTPDPTSGHWPDTFKKPNHPTFSNQSKYAAIMPERAGRWNGETFTFAPPPAAKKPVDVGDFVSRVKARRFDPYADKDLGLAGPSILDETLGRTPSTTAPIGPRADPEMLKIEAQERAARDAAYERGLNRWAETNPPGHAMPLPDRRELERMGGRPRLADQSSEELATGARADYESKREPIERVLDVAQAAPLRSIEEAAGHAITGETLPERMAATIRMLVGVHPTMAALTASQAALQQAKAEAKAVGAPTESVFEYGYKANPAIAGFEGLVRGGGALGRYAAGPDATYLERERAQHTGETFGELAALPAALLAGKAGAKIEPPVADFVARLRASRIPLETPRVAAPTEAAPPPGYENLPQLEGARISRLPPKPFEGVRGAEPPRPALPNNGFPLGPYRSGMGERVTSGPGVMESQIRTVPGMPLPEGQVPAPAPALPFRAGVPPRALPEQAGPTNYPNVMLTPEQAAAARAAALAAQRGAMGILPEQRRLPEFTGFAQRTPETAPVVVPRTEPVPPARSVAETINVPTPVEPKTKKPILGTPTAGTGAEPVEGASPAGAIVPAGPATPIVSEGGMPTAKFGRGKGGKAVPSIATEPEPPAHRFGRRPPEIDLIPPLDEGTVPTARERVIEAQGGPRAVAAATGRELVEQKDGTLAIVPPERVAEAQALAEQGKLAEIVNGEGTSPKPAAPSEVVVGRDAQGAEVRSVLVENEAQRASAQKALTDAGLTVETKPATTENLNAVLEARGAEPVPAATPTPSEGVPSKGQRADPTQTAPTGVADQGGARARTVETFRARAKGSEPFEMEAADNKIDTRGEGTFAEGRIVTTAGGKSQAQFREGFDPDTESWQNLGDFATRDEAIAALADHTMKTDRPIRPSNIEEPSAAAAPAKGASPEATPVLEQEGAAAAETGSGVVTEANRYAAALRRADAALDAGTTVKKGSAEAIRYGGKPAAPAAVEAPATPETLPKGVFYKTTKHPDGSVTRELRGRTADLNVEAASYQHRRDANAKGTTERARDVKTWKEPTDPISVWFNPETQTVDVVNGHHRMSIAERSNQPDVPLKFVEAANKAEARLVGFLENLKGGNIDPIDAADYFRGEKMTPEQVDAFLTKHGVSAKLPGVAGGRAVAALPDAAWDQYVRQDRFNERANRRAIVTGDAIRDQKLDSDQALQLIDATKKMPVDEIAGTARSVRLAGSESKGGTVGLFGEIAPPKSLVELEGKLRSRMLEVLAEDKRTVGATLRNAEALKKKGVADVDTELSKELVGTSKTLHDQAQAWIKSEGRTPIDDFVSEAARQVDDMRTTEDHALNLLVQKAKDWLLEDPTTRAEVAKYGRKAPAGPLFGGPAEHRVSAGDVTLPETKTAEPPVEGATPPEPPPGGEGKGPPRFGKRSERGMALTPFSPDDWKGLPGKLAQATQEAMSKVKREVDDLTYGERLQWLWHRTQDFVRAEAPIERLERSRGEGVSPTGPTARAFYGQGATGKQAETLWREGAADFGRRVTDPIEPLIDAVIKDGDGQKLSAFLVAERVDKRYTPHGLDSGFDPRWASEFSAEIKKSHPKIVKAAQAINRAFQELLDELYVAGGLTKDAWDRIKRDNGEFYVPMERVVERGTSSTGFGGSGPMQTRGLHAISAPELKGGTHIRFEGTPKQGTTIETEMPPVRDPLIRAFEHMRQMFGRINQARTAKALAEWYDLDPKQAAEAGMKEVQKPGTSFDEFYSDTLAKDPTTPPSEILKRWEESRPADTLQTVVGGKLRSFEFSDPAMARAMKSLRPEVAIPFMRAMSFPTAVKRILTTGINVGFQLVQPWRDSAMYLLKPRGSLKETGRSLVNLPIGYIEGIYNGLRLATSADNYLPGSKLSQFYDRLPTEGFFDADLIRGPRGLRPSTVGAVAETARPLQRSLTAAGGVESGPRKAEVLNQIGKMGKTLDDPFTPDELMQIANESAKVTTPFKAGSSPSKAIARTQAYFNAQLQGVRQISEWMGDHPVETSIRLGAISVLPAVLLWAKNHDKEWYKRIPAKIRYSTTQPTEGVRLPSRGLVDVPGKLVQMALDRYADEKPADAESLTSEIMSIMGQGAPDAPIPGRDVLQPIFEVMTNHSLFTGQPINPRGSENVDTRAPEMVARSTDPKALAAVAKWYRQFAESLGIKSKLTTAELSHFARQFLGPPGMESLNLMDEQTGTPEPRDTPIFGRFAPVLRTSAYIGKFYDLASQMEGSQRAAGIAKTKGDAIGQVAFELPKSSRARLERIKERMRTLMTQYDDAPNVEAKKSLARLMDAEAKDGITIMEEALGTSKKVAETLGR
jgi:hypothetical protein